MDWVYASFVVSHGSMDRGPTSHRSTCTRCVTHGLTALVPSSHRSGWTGGSSHDDAVTATPAPSPAVGGAPDVAAAEVASAVVRPTGTRLMRRTLMTSSEPSAFTANLPNLAISVALGCGTIFTSVPLRSGRAARPKRRYVPLDATSEAKDEALIGSARLACYL